VNRFVGLAAFALFACRGLDPILCEPCDGVCGDGLVCQTDICVAPGDPGACLLECAVDADCERGDVCYVGMCHPRYVDVALGNTTGCVLEPSGRVKCWGANVAGLAGAPASTPIVATPNSIPGVEDATELACGSSHCCVVRRDRTLTCWGNDDYDQLASGDLTGVTRLFAGQETTCAVLEDGQLRCFGTNDRQELGHPDDFARIEGPIEAVAMGSNHTCAVAEGRVYCWGEGAAGMFGAQTPLPGTQLFDTGLTDVTSIAAGYHHTCVTRESGSVLCWGPSAGANVPDLGGRAVQIRAGASWTCARLEDGEVVCWGAIVNHVDLATPLRFSGAKRIEVGHSFACLLDDDSRLRCWGSTASGQLGVDISPLVATPRPLDLPRVEAVDVGSTHSCALDEPGGLWCWGNNTSGQLGSAAAPLVGGHAVRVELDEARDFAAGANHTCALDPKNRVHCWGRNDWGQVLPGGPAEIRAPVEIVDAPDAIALRANWDRSCVIDREGWVTCWGRYFAGVTPVPELGQVRALALGDHHVCAVTLQDTVVCIGAYLFGVDHWETPDLPVPLPGPAEEVIAGGSISCARLQNGDVYCWGNNEQGALGSNNRIHRMAPERVYDFSGAVEIRGKQHSPCARLGSGAWSCWGQNEAHNLANGNARDELRPTRVEHLSATVDFVIGADHSCAVRTDRHLECWGSNGFGQVTAVPTRFLEPTLVDGL
jgi:alpha-tubulin suppressor-like RCC1 family protein